MNYKGLTGRIRRRLLLLLRDDERMQVIELNTIKNYDYSFDDFIVSMQSKFKADLDFLVSRGEMTAEIAGQQDWLESFSIDTCPKELKELLEKTFEAGRRSIHKEGSIMIGESDEAESGDGGSND